MKRWVMAIVFLSSLLAVTWVGSGLKNTIRAEEGDPEPSEDVVIDETNFPDEVFRSYVKTNIDKNQDNVLSQIEIGYARSIDLQSVSSMKGIEYFTSLRKLHLTSCKMNELDLSQNLELEELWCNDCPLKSLDLSQNTSLIYLRLSKIQFECLDLSKNTELRILYCAGCPLKSLNLSQNKKLQILDCSANQLKELDVSENTALRELYCNGNQLTSLDVSKNVLLTDLRCYDNALTTLDVRTVPYILKTVLRGSRYLENGSRRRYLLREKGKAYDIRLVVDWPVYVITSDDSVEPNPGPGIKIDESVFPDALFREYVRSHMDYDKDNILSEFEREWVTEIYVPDSGISSLKGIEIFTSLTKLVCSNNKLESLDLSENTELRELYCNGNQLTNLDIRTLPGFVKAVLYGERRYNEETKQYIFEQTVDHVNVRYEMLVDSSVYIIVSDDSLDPPTGIEINETNFPDNYFRYLVSIQYDRNVDNILSSEEIDKILEFKHVGYDSHPQRKISSLKGIEYFTSLTTLNCQNNYLTSLDVSKNTQLLSLDCSFNKLDSLDVGQNTKLKLIDCQSNKLVNLNVSGSTSLTNLNCNKNELTALDVSNCKKLTSLDCNYNRMSVLDVSKNTKLENLYCNSNLLTELDVSKNTLLTKLRCNENQLTNLDVRQNTLLKDLQCKVNQLTELDVSQNALEYLLCSYNNLRQLDLTKCQLGIEYCKEQGYAGFSRDGKLFYAYEFYEYGGEIRHFEVDSFVKTKPKYFDPKPTPTPTNTPTPTPSPTNTPTPTQGPTPTPKEPTQGPTVTPTPTKAPVKDPTFEDFVERLYTVALGRASEPEGKAFWIKQVVEEGKTGADCARFFLLDADEFMKRGLSVEDFVETLYATFFDRESDAAGKKGWVDAIKSGKKTRAEVVNDFIESTEWCNVCATYGVKSGAKWHKATFASKNAKDFTTRLYTCCLGRDPEEGGLKYWSLALTNLEQTGCSAAKLFFTSDEFVGFKLKDEEYIKRLYTTFMGREPAASEVSYWMGEIKKGTQTKYSVMQFFGQSPEFTEICKKYGIDRGEI